MSRVQYIACNEQTHRPLVIIQVIKHESRVLNTD